jgi:hypothetical protein
VRAEGVLDWDAGPHGALLVERLVVVEALDNLYPGPHGGGFERLFG